MRYDARTPQPSSKLKNFVMSAQTQSRREPSATAGNLRFRPVTIDTQRDGAGVIRMRANEPLPAYPERMHDHLFQWARQTPAQVLLAERRPGQSGWATISYAEAADKVRTIAAALAQRNLGPERPVMILSGNSIEHQLLALGAMTAGIPFAPISVAYSLVSQDLGKLRHILKLLDPGLVYAASGKMFARALTIADMSGREIVVGTPVQEVPGATPFAELLKGAPADALAAADRKINADTIAKFLFTSGSTGVPKGVITTHRMLNSNLAMEDYIWPFMTARPPVLVDWLPWSHVFGGNHNFNQVLKNGGTLYIDDGKPIAAEFEKSIAKPARGFVVDLSQRAERFRTAAALSQERRRRASTANSSMQSSLNTFSMASRRMSGIRAVSFQQRIICCGERGVRRRYRLTTAPSVATDWRVARPFYRQRPSQDQAQGVRTLLS